MLRFIHAADFHLDSAFAALTPRQAAARRRESRELPVRLANYVNQNNIDLVLLAGDLFDSAASYRDTAEELSAALGQMEAQVYIAPGNHDWYGPGSPYLTVKWPENVHIFTQPRLETMEWPEKNLVLHGAAFTHGEQADGFLTGFTAPADGKLHIGLLHGEIDPSEARYDPIRREEIAASGLDYLALGHIHKSGAYRAGRTLCAWPGCPMGRGFDETGVKGALVVTLEDTAQTRFVPLDTPRFFDYTLSAGNDPAAALATVLPPTQSQNFYRVTLVGESAPFQIPQLLSHFPALHNLQILDKTVPPVDPWSRTGEDSLEGMLFRILQDSLAGQDIAMQQKITLAAKISRQILDGQEVDLS